MSLTSLGYGCAPPGWAAHPRTAVAHRRCAGGVSGSVRGTIKASWRIAMTFARIALERKLPAAKEEGKAAGKGAR